VTPEGDVKKEVKKILKEWGVFYFMPVGHMYGRQGASDFICCYCGTFLAIEVKKDCRTKATKLQTMFGEAVLASKGVWLVIHDENMSLLTSALKRISRGECF
jgi:hypothetical protein